MNHHYSDIRSLSNAEPKWFDENAVPRYCEFTPDQTANIYANKCVLVLIACQDCGRHFEVCLSSDSIQYYVQNDRTLWEGLQSLHYGDPPNVQCCPAGPTMNCVDVRILQAWEQEPFGDWQRKPEYEIALEGAAL